MTDGSDRIERYLDQLLDELRGRARDVRRTLAEAEDHLREAAARGETDGLTPDDAQCVAIERFGSPRVVARRFASERGRWLPRSVLVETVLVLALIGGVGLVGIGVSGALAGALGAAAGKTFVAGDPSGVTYTPSRCADFREYFPKASSCEEAAVDHHFDEVVSYRLAAGVLGVLVISGYYLVRRRRPRSAVPALSEGFAATVGATLFGCAAAVLLLPSLGQMAFGDTSGVGAALTGGLVSAVAAAGFAASLYRTMHAKAT